MALTSAAPSHTHLRGQMHFEGLDPKLSAAAHTATAEEPRPSERFSILSSEGLDASQLRLSSLAGEITKRFILLYQHEITAVNLSSRLTNRCPFRGRFCMQRRIYDRKAFRWDAKWSAPHPRLHSTGLLIRLRGSLRVATSNTRSSGCMHWAHVACVADGPFKLRQRRTDPAVSVQSCRLICTF